MTKKFVTKDKELAHAVRVVQNKRSGVQISLVGCKRVDGVYIPRDQVHLVRPDLFPNPLSWIGTTDVFPVEPDDEDPTDWALELTDPTLEGIDEAKAKPGGQRTDDEKTLAKVDKILEKQLKVASKQKATASL